MSEPAARPLGDVVQVLVVGDSERVEAATAALEAAFSVPTLLSARTASDAIDRLSDVDVHCVVADVGRDAAGPSSLERIRSRNADLPIVALVEEDLAVDALEAGASDVLYPGEPPAAVASRVRNAIERHRDEAATTDDRYRAVLEAATAPVLVLDADGDVEYASSSIEATGYTPDELEREGFARLVHPEEREDARTEFLETASGSLGSKRRSSYRIARDDGTWRVSTVTFTNRLADPAVEGVVVTVQETMSGFERTVGDPLVDAVDRLEDPIVALGPRWEVTGGNAAAGRLFERPIEELAGTVVWDLLPEAVAGTFYERLSEARATGEVVEFEVEYPPREAWLEVAVHPSESGVSVHARERSEPGEGRDRLDLFESVVDALDDGVFALDGSTVALANAAVFELVDADVVEGRDLSELFDEELVDSILERARSPVVRRGEPIEGTVALDGRRREVAVSVTPIRGDDRAVCVVRDATERRAREAATETLYETAEALARAETRPEVGQVLVDAAADVLEADVVALYLADPQEGTFRPVAHSTPGADTDAKLPTIETGESAFSDALGEDGASVHDPVAFEPFLVRAGIRADRVLTVPVGGDGIVVSTATEPEAFTGGVLEYVDALAGMGSVAFDRVERLATIRESERELSSRRERLDRIAQIDERTRDVARTLLRAESRDELERTVCDRLAEVDWIELVWIGEVDGAVDEVTPRAWAGEGEEYLDAVSVELGADVAEPTGRAAATGEVVVVENVVQEGNLLEWRREALEREFGSVLSAPVAYDEHVYGTLTVFADRPSAFPEGASAAFVALGETIAAAINAVETRRALLTDGVTELELATTADDPLTSIASRAACRLDVESVVPRSAHESTVFVTVSEASTEAVRDVATDLDGVTSVRSIAEHEDGSLLELAVEGSTIASTVANHSGVLRTVSHTGERARLVVELPRESDVGAFVRTLEREQPGTELLARRERDRRARPRRAFETELRRRLTDRQLRALEAAYYSGFFEWPRESTGEEVARSLGISQPTFNRHFRAAERKLFELLFDERDGGEGYQ